jgi:hypothetical protein
VSLVFTIRFAERIPFGFIFEENLHFVLDNVILQTEEENFENDWTKNT